MQWLTLKLLVAALLFGAAAKADINDLLLNDDNLATIHERPRIAVMPSGSFVVTWADQRNGQSDIFLQRVSATGARIDANKIVNDDTLTSWQAFAAIGVSASGEYSIVWQDFRNSSYPYDPDIFLGRTDSTVAFSDANVSVTVELPDSLKESPDIAVASSGASIVVWADYRNRNWDIYGQLLAVDGSLSGSNFKINDDINAAQQHGARVAASSDGWFVVVWYDNRQGTDDIFAQVYSSTGVKKGSNLRVNSDITSARQISPDVAADGRGRFHVVWVDWRNGTYPINPDIYSRRFDTNFVALSIDTKVNPDASTRPQRDPAIAADRMGNVAMVWADSTASSWDVMGQILDADGTIRVGGFRAHPPSDSAQLQPDIALDGRYRYVTWADKRNGRFDIYTSVVKYNDPHLAATPAALSFTMNAGGPLPAAQQVVVEHAGLNPLNYQAVASESWLQVAPTSGQTVETLSVSIASTLPEGTHLADLRIIDATNYDSSLVIPVTVVSEIPASTDSVILGAISCLPLDTALLPLNVTLGSAMHELIIPLVWDSNYFDIGALELGDSLVGRATATKAHDQAGRVVVRVTADPGDSLPPGSYEAVRLSILANAAEGFVMVDSLTIDSFSLRVEATDGRWLAPEFVPGEVTVSSTTDVANPGSPATLPKLTLEQNYPNPFNAGTVIRFALPRREVVRIEIFNVLGQVMRTLVDESMSAGEHSVAWNGRLADGHEASSGIFFYRLQFGQASLVRKLVVLK